MDEKKCECVCDIVCIATMSVDTETCTCKPIEYPSPPTEEFTCDSEGVKQCKDEKPECEQGKSWDEKACMCMNRAQCRKGCPYG